MTSEKESEEWVDLCEGMLTCELCQIQFSEEAFYEHLKTHTKEEVEALKRLAELSLKNREAYEELRWQLVVLEYTEREKESGENNA